MIEAAELTAYLERRFGPSSATTAPLHWEPGAGSPVPPTARSYTAALRDDVTTGAIQLGTVLNTDRGRLFAAAVQAMSPPLARPFEQLLIGALIEVAREQTDRRRQGALLAAAGVATLGLAVSLLPRLMTPTVQR